MSLDSIICSACEDMPKLSYENNLESIDMFIDSAQINLKKAGLSDLLQKKKFKINVTKYTDRNPTTFLLNENEELVIYSIYLYKDLKEELYTYEQRHSFQFVKIKDQFRLYAMESN